MRPEFVCRGYVHTLQYAYIKDAQQYAEVDNETVAGFYATVIFISFHIKEEHRKYIEYWLHRHLRTCCIDNTHIAYLPSQCHLCHIVILELLDVDTEDEHKLYKEMWSRILQHLQDYGMRQDGQETFSEMLNE